MISRMVSAAHVCVVWALIGACRAVVTPPVAVGLRGLLQQLRELIQPLNNTLSLQDYA